MPHFAITGAFLELHPELLEAIASFLHVIDGYSNVSEAAARIIISGRVTVKVGVRLRAVIVRQLEHT